MVESSRTFRGCEVGGGPCPLRGAGSDGRTTAGPGESTTHLAQQRGALPCARASSALADKRRARGGLVFKRSEGAISTGSGGKWGRELASVREAQGGKEGG